MKNAQPNIIAGYAALIISLLVFIQWLILVVFGLLEKNWHILFFMVVLTFLAVYTVVYLFIKYYIFQKINLIYQIIHSEQKSSFAKKDNAQALEDDIFTNVEIEVNNWINEKRAAQSALDELETYRRNFLGNVSHELKTPIFNIQGFLYTLIDGGLHDEQINLSYLKKAAKNVDRLQTIVEDLETIGKLESGKFVLEMQEFDVKELVEEVFEEIEPKAKDKKVHLKFKIEADENFKVKGDYEYIRIVLLNLLINSIKYGKAQGTSKVGFYDMGSNVLVEVSDDGIGIEDKHLAHLFDRFYRVDKGRSREEGGSGLGLSIVKHIIEAHQQAISVRSTFGVGTTFSFTLEKS